MLTDFCIFSIFLKAVCLGTPTFPVQEKPFLTECAVVVMKCEQYHIVMMNNNTMCS